MMLMTAFAEERAAGKYAGKVESARDWMVNPDGVPMEITAKILKMTVAQFEQVLTLIRANPEWDDVKIAGKVKWS